LINFTQPIKVCLSIFVTSFATGNHPIASLGSPQDISTI